MGKGFEASADSVAAASSWCQCTCLSLGWSKGSHGVLTTDACAEQLENEPFLKAVG